MTMEKPIRFVSCTTLKIIDLVQENKISVESAIELVDVMKANGFVDKHDKFFDAVKSHYEQTVSEKNILDTKFKKLAKDNADYFSDVVSSPASKMELSNALTQLIARSNLKLAKMNLNSADPSKGEIIEIEIDGINFNIYKTIPQQKRIPLKKGVKFYVCRSCSF